MWGKWLNEDSILVCVCGGEGLGLKTSGRWRGVPLYPPALRPLLSIWQSPDFQGIFHGVKDSLKIQNATIVNLGVVHF